MLAGFLILPLLWSVPEALITAELATAFPENSGYVAWVTAAFGPFWGFQEGFWSWLSGVTDNSIYPVMFADNLRIFVPALNDGWPRCVLRSAQLLLPPLPGQNPCYCGGLHCRRTWWEPCWCSCRLVCVDRESASNRTRRQCHCTALCLPCCNSHAPLPVVALYGWC